MSTEGKKETKDEIIRRQSKERFLTFDQEKMLEIFKLPHDETVMKIRFLGKEYEIERATGELYLEGAPASIDEMASIYELLTMSESLPKSTRTWASIAQLCTNTTDTSLGRYIEYLEPFDGKMELMEEACKKLGGIMANKGDVSSIIRPFEGIDLEVWFQYWEKDEEFPASVQFLWDESIVNHFRWSVLWNVMTCLCNRMKEEVGL